MSNSSAGARVGRVNAISLLPILALRDSKLVGLAPALGSLSILLLVAAVFQPLAFAPGHALRFRLSNFGVKLLDSYWHPVPSPGLTQNARG